MGLDQVFFSAPSDIEVTSPLDDPRGSCLDVHATGVTEIVRLRNHYALHELVRCDIADDWEGSEYLELYDDDVPIIASLGAVATLCRVLTQCFEDGKRVFYRQY